MVRFIWKEGVMMEKFIKKYGIIVLLYLVIICGVLLLNERIRLLNEVETTKVVQYSAN